MLESGFHANVILTEDRIFASCDVVKGSAHISTDTVQLLVGPVKAQLRGAVEWTTQETVTTTNSDGSTSTSYETRHHSETVLSLVQTLMPCGPKDVIQFNPGRVELPFSFLLPDGIPATVDHDPGVSYTVELTYSFGTIIRTARRPFIVAGFQESLSAIRKALHTPLVQELASSPFIGDSGLLTCTFTFAQTALIKGQSCGLGIRLQNGTKQTVVGVQLSFWGSEPSAPFEIDVNCPPGGVAEVHNALLQCPSTTYSSFSAGGHHMYPLSFKARVESTFRMDVRSIVSLLWICTPCPALLGEVAGGAGTDAGSMMAVSYPEAVTPGSVSEAIQGEIPLVKRPDGLPSPQGAAPFLYWQPDDELPNCALCKDEFGFFRRRHHCRLCGSLLCDSCTPKTVLRILGTKPVRICLRCVSSSPVYQAEYKK